MINILCLNILCPEAPEPMRTGQDPQRRCVAVLPLTVFSGFMKSDYPPQFKSLSRTAAPRSRRPHFHGLGTCSRVLSLSRSRNHPACRGPCSRLYRFTVFENFHTVRSLLAVCWPSVECPVCFYGHRNLRSSLRPLVPKSPLIQYLQSPNPQSSRVSPRSYSLRGKHFGLP